jgi:mono/diheme cytochrome c family protein
VLFPGAEAPMSENDLTDPLRRGLYLVAIGHCMNCHAERSKDDVPNFITGAGKGGRVFSTGVTAANLTSSVKGLRNWSDMEIRRALTDAISRDGRALKPPMSAYAPFYRGMKDEDINAIIAFLRSLPPLE